MGMLRLGSSLRERDPVETLALASPLMDAFGISRVTDVTRMDRLGLPVAMSVRPRSRSLHVHAGKGLRAVDARIGALMEALEFAVAEPQRTHWMARTISAAGLQRAWGTGLRFDDLPLRMDSAVSPRDEWIALPCEDLITGTWAPLPADLVFMPFHSPARPEVLQSTTNGLASGNSVVEATLHALLEVLERDALAFDLLHRQSAWVDPAGLPAPFPALAQRWAELGVPLAVRHVPNAFGLPCFKASLHDKSDSGVGMSIGSGLHLSPAIAVSRAISEAAQGRLSHIHGGRDDITNYFSHRASLGAAGRAQADADWAAAAFDRTRNVAFGAVADCCPPAATLTVVLGDLLRRVWAAGFPRVYRHIFDAELHGLSVVRVVVPRCEDLSHGIDFMSARLKAQVSPHA